MSGEAVRRHHANPGIRRRPVATQFFPKSANLAKGVGMVESQQLFRQAAAKIPVNFVKPGLNRLQIRRIKARRNEHRTQGVHVAPRSSSAKQRGFEDRGPAPHERIINQISRLGEPFNEKAGQLRLETGPVGNLMQGTGSPLF